MYEKIAETGELAYFMYAPPLPFYLSPAERGPNRPFPTAEPWQCSVYYFWWAYLRENEDYIACCTAGGNGRFRDVYRDFGDVRGDDFIAWWEARGRELFREPEESTEIVTLNGYHRPAIGLDELHAAQNSLVVSIPLRADVELTLRKLRAVLKQEIQARRTEVRYGERRARLGASRYPVETKPVLASLHQTLAVWNAKKAATGKVSPQQIADMAGLPIHAISSGTAESLDRRKARAVWRHLTAAKCLIRNVGDGRFPDFSLPPRREP